jgi:hypothetical protein
MTVACCFSVDFSIEMRGTGPSCFNTLDGVREGSRIQTDRVLGDSLIKFTETQNYPTYQLVTLKQQVQFLHLAHLLHKFSTNNLGLHFDPRELALWL